MKIFATAALIFAMSAATVSASTEEQVEYCVLVGDLIFELGKLRDNNIPPSFVHSYLVDEFGVDLDMATELVTLVYLTGEGVDGDVIKSFFVSACVGGLV
tara:strand:+ start:2059 stop:2358 length:300 start_codon:yes stop_codon:yes gene_type:complete